jgi:hypothetical protein
MLNWLSEQKPGASNGGNVLPLFDTAAGEVCLAGQVQKAATRALIGGLSHVGHMDLKLVTHLPLRIKID